MDRKKIEYYKRKLIKKKEELSQVVARTENYGRATESGETQDIADMASSAYTKEFLFSKSNNDRHVMQMIDEALKRIEEESYGECMHCGKEIQQKRLEAVPWARYCIECQELQEKGLIE